MRSCGSGAASAFRTTVRGNYTDDADEGLKTKEKETEDKR